MLLSLQKGIPTNQSISVSNGVSHYTLYDSILIHNPTIDDSDEVDVIGEFLWGFHIVVWGGGMIRCLSTTS
jgi:hypothetical protein